MSACEKCWRDAHADPYAESVTSEYHRLLADRHGIPCTAEEQAGPDATICDWCGRRTRHQHTGECMACGERAA